MLIYVKKKKKNFLRTDGRTDGRTDRRTTQNYSSEPHKKAIIKNKNSEFQFIQISPPTIISL